MTLGGHSADTVVLDPLWSPDGQRLATTAFDSVGHKGETIVWSRDGALLQRLPVPDQINDLAWSPDGTRLAGAGNDRVGRIWDVATGSPEIVLSGHQGPVNVIAWIDDGELATGSEDESVRLWSADSGGQIAELRGHRGEVRALAVPPGGLLVLSASADRTIREWSAARDVIPRTGPALADLSGTTATSGDGHWLLVLDDAGADTPQPAVIDTTGREPARPVGAVGPRPRRGHRRHRAARRSQRRAGSNDPTQPWIPPPTSSTSRPASVSRISRGRRSHRSSRRSIRRARSWPSAPTTSRAIRPGRTARSASSTSARAGWSAATSTIAAATTDSEDVRRVRLERRWHAARLRRRRLDHPHLGRAREASRPYARPAAPDCADAPGCAGRHQPRRPLVGRGGGVRRQGVRMGSHWAGRSPSWRDTRATSSTCGSTPTRS